MPEFGCDLNAPTTPLPHHWEFCVGSGYAPLATRADWQRQLERCRRELGVQHVRFHGVLCDQMGTFVEQRGQQICSFFNADTVYDALIDMGVSPLVELSFMPKALASEKQTVFSYEGHVSPPKSAADWTQLIKRLTAHWVERYGRDALLQWPVEVWNEPNMQSFWTGSQEQYFEFYESTARAIKEVTPALRVGGPVSAKTEWIEEFLEFVAKRNCPCDFVSTHYYPTDAHAGETDSTPDQLGKSSRHAMRELLSQARGHAFGRPLYLTEWNMTSNSRDDMHDEPIAAVYLIKGALELAGVVQGSSWWTFSDIFAENYFPARPFHGGFGLLSWHGIPKPSYRAMQLLHELGGEQLPVHAAHESVDCWVVRKAGEVQIMLTNLCLPGTAPRSELVKLKLGGATEPRRVSIRRIDEEYANPRREWVEMGAPEQLTARDVDRLQSASAMGDDALHWELADGQLRLDVPLPANAVALVTCQFDEERGYGAGGAGPNAQPA